MAVVSVEALWVGRKGKDDIDKHRTYTSRYEVITSDPADDPTVAGGTSLLPRLGDSLATDIAAIVVAVIPEQLDDSPYHWHVDIEYDTQLPDRQGKEAQGHDSSGNATTAADPNSRPENPLDRDPVWTTDSETEEEPLIVDANGDPILNSAGDPFDPSLMTKGRRWVTNLTKNVASLDFSVILTYIDTTNQAIWKGVPIGLARITKIRKSSKKENGIVFTEVNVEITIKKGGWNRLTVDRGYRQLIDTTGFGDYEQFPIYDSNTGAFVTDPALLDGSGLQLDAGLPAVIYPPDGYVEFLPADFDAFMTILGVP